MAGKAGDLLIVPGGLHSIEAEEDSAVLFTVVKTDRLVQLPASGSTTAAFGPRAEVVRVIDTPEATHIRYRVRR